MFEELNQYLAWNDHFQKVRFLLLTSEGTDIGFLIPHFMSYFLKKGVPICLVTVAQTFPHYAQACAKIGTNLDKAKSEGKVVHIDLLSTHMEQYLGIQESQWNARTVFANLRQELELMTHDSHDALLVVDDFSVFPLLETSDCEPSVLLRYLCSIASSLGCLFLTAIPTLAHGSCRTLQNFAIHQADMVLRCKSLPTGYSKEVHGQLEVLKGGCNQDPRQYKLTEKSLNLFASGTSYSVL